MEFTKATQLKNHFKVRGSFYNQMIYGQLYKCRNYAEVYRSDCEDQFYYDVIVVLAYPGPSAPKKYTYHTPHITFGESIMVYTPAIPDIPQYQIMRIMQFKNWNNVLLINLSDLREGNLVKFKRKLNAMQRVGYESHSIFSSQRSQELQLVLERCDGPIILAWGTDEK